MIKYVLRSVHSIPYSYQKVQELLSPMEYNFWCHLGSDNRKREWFLGRAVAKSVLRSELIKIGFKDIPLNKVKILSSDNGRPIVDLLLRKTVNFNISLSLSHTSRFILFAYQFSSNGYLGVDVEKVREVDKDMISTFISEDELALIDLEGLDLDGFLFTSIWGLKESVLKATGKGINSSMGMESISIRAIDSAQREFELYEEEMGIFFKGRVLERDQHILSICYSF